MSDQNNNDETKTVYMNGMDRRGFLKKTAVVGGARVASAVLCYGVEKSEAAPISTQGSARDLPAGNYANLPTFNKKGVSHELN